MRISKRAYLTDVLAETVVIHTGSQSIEGVMVGVYADTIVLVHASLLGSDGSKLTLDGETLIPRDKVQFIQRLGAPAEGGLL